LGWTDYRFTNFQNIRPLAKVVAEVLWGLNKGDRKKRVSDRWV
jgi:hypothetical protein